jgi:CubicO group peptidase (beta-lactamase class C family)
MKKYTSIISLLVITFSSYAQVDKKSELYKIIKVKDRLLFDVGFNTRDITKFENLISDNFEFYHDQNWITKSKSAFIASIESGLFKLDYKASRRLIDSTLEIYPLKRNGILYGALERGSHSFYASSVGKPKYQTSIAKFTHLWLLENGEWKFSRGLSYDHTDFEEPIVEALLFTDKDETYRWLKKMHIPALGIGFIEQGEIKQISVFGELERDDPAPINTIWNVASLAKPITAMVTLKLIEKGKLKLDEPLCRYYTDPDIVADPNVKKLTPRIILSHQTGFPNWRTGKLIFQFELGTKYQYAGEGYEYLRKVLESKFRKSLDQLADELIFRPLKMRSTSYIWSDKTEEARFAKWHTANGTLYETEKNEVANGADNLLTTVEDYTKFMLYILNEAGLPSRLWKEMTTKQVRINDYKNFGLGWWIDENINTNKDFALVHGGDDVGVHTIAFLLPKTKTGLLIFTNSDNGTDVFEPILLKFLGNDGQGILNVEMK